MGDVKVTILPRRETREVEAADVAHLLRALGLHQDAYIVIREEVILTRDVRLQAEDQIEVWPVISGGGPAQPGSSRRSSSRGDTSPLTGGS